LKTAPAPRTRRRPKLRVVGGPARVRHATVVQFGGGLRYIVETWTFDEYSKLNDWERPVEPFILPGVGYLAVELVGTLNHREAEDIIAATREAPEW
jgi:hypothetical protein